MKRLAFLALILIASSAHASLSQLKGANRQFRNGHYDSALKLYDDALIDSPHSPVLRFNAGAAAYQTGDFTRAEKEFKESADSADPGIRAASHYNRGNALFRQNRYSDAIEAYKEALRINPKDENAKYNLSVALRAKQNPPKPQSGNGKADQKNQQSKAEQAKESSGKDPSEKKPEMSREDAERLLSAAASGEKKKDQKAKGEGKQVDEDW